MQKVGHNCNHAQTSCNGKFPPAEPQKMHQSPRWTNTDSHGLPRKPLPGSGRPHDKGSRRQAMPFRQPRTAAPTPRSVHRRLQLRPQAEDSQRPDIHAIHMKGMAGTAGLFLRRTVPFECGTIHPQVGERHKPSEAGQYSRHCPVFGGR